jgi:hypothetical protein
MLFVTFDGETRIAGATTSVTMNGPVIMIVKKPRRRPGLFVE